MNNLTLNYINTTKNNPVESGYHWVESWLFSTNAKQIGILYGVFALFSGLVGLALSIAMRIELASPNPQILLHNGQLWNVLITAHAVFMVFFLVMPITMGAFGNYLVPLMIGTSDTAFPRINNIAFWLLVPSLLFAVLSCLVDEGPGTGWTIKICSSKISFDAWNTISNYTCILSYIIIEYVTMFNIIGQYANFKSNLKFQRLNMIKLKYIRWFKTSKPNSLNIDEWIVGLTDGDGTFNIDINPKNHKIQFTYKISLLEKNRQLFHKLKTYLKIGNIYNDGKMIHYRIRDKEKLLNTIIPIFDKYPLLTSKRFSYLNWKECLLISNKMNLTQMEKIKQIEEIKLLTLPNNYISDRWNNILHLIDFSELNIYKQYSLISTLNISNIMSKSWLIGFIEAEGSFYIIKKSNSHLIHAFGLSQKLDYIVLLSIKLLLNIKSSIKIKSAFYNIETTNSKNIEYIINYFIYNDHKSYFSGMKSYEFSIWKRSYFKYKGNYSKLYAIREMLRTYRKI